MLNPKQWNRYQAGKAKKAPKYGNKKVVVNGITYDSTGEYNYERTVLEPLRLAGKLTYQRQVNFTIEVNGVKICSYRADWVVTYADGTREVVDFKGYETPEFKLKKKLMKAVHGIEVSLPRKK